MASGDSNKEIENFPDSVSKETIDQIAKLVSKRLSSDNLLETAVGGLLLIGTLNMGAIDFIRTGYNTLVGDTLNQKYKLVNYIVCEDSPKYNSREALISSLATELNAPLYNNRIRPEMVSITALYDAAEDRVMHPMSPNADRKQITKLWEKHVWSDVAEFAVPDCKYKN